MKGIIKIKLLNKIKLKNNYINNYVNFLDIYRKNESATILYLHFNLILLIIFSFIIFFNSFSEFLFSKSLSVKFISKIKSSSPMDKVFPEMWFSTDCFDFEVYSLFDFFFLNPSIVLFLWIIIKINYILIFNIYN